MVKKKGDQLGQSFKGFEKSLELTFYAVLGMAAVIGIGKLFFPDSSGFNSIVSFVLMAFFAALSIGFIIALIKVWPRKLPPK